MKRTSLYALFFLSGIAGLGYEILWTRMLSVSLGHEMVSVLAVVSAFFSGLAAGSWILDRPVSRSGDPGRWYALFEVIIGIWSIVLLFILPDLNRLVSGLIGLAPTPLRHWSVSFLYPFIVLLPATIAMGGTLPAMDRLVEQKGGGQRKVAGIYGINTFGAMAGTLLVTFFLMPALGMNQTSILLAIANVICASAVFMLANGDKGDRAAKIPPTPSPIHLPQFYMILFVTGLLGVGFEVLMVRALSQILENTVFSFAAMLAVFLFGTALGAGLYQKCQRSHTVQGTLSLLLLSSAFFCLIATLMLRYVEPVFQALQQFYGRGFQGAVAAELSTAMLFFLLPTISMGATFSHLAQLLKNPDGGVGRALCLNTLGGACAPFFFGVFLLPAIGITHALLLIPMVYLLCFPRWRISYAAAGGVLVIILLLVAGDFGKHPFVSLAEGEKVVSHREGVMASVSVVQDARDDRHLRVNNHFQMGGTTSVFSDRRQAYLPLLLHPEPCQALFLGVGTGTTLAAAANFRGLKAEGVELVPEVISAMDYFESATGDVENHKNLRIVNADARRYVVAADKQYDVVVADLFHPSRDGAGSLYTFEHFEAIRGLLAEGGIFCQWLPLYQLDLETFKVITRTFLEVFPEGQAFLAHYSIDQPIIGLVGGTKALRFPENWYRKRVKGKGFRNHMAGFGYDSIYSLLGTFMADSNALHRYAGDGPVNTDAFPVVLFRAPRFVYGDPGPPHERLSALLTAFSPPETETILAEIVTEEDHVARTRLSAYWSARDSFLEVGSKIGRTNDVVQLYKAAGGPLLGVVRKSVDFSAAYFPLISIAYDIYPHDRDASYRLLRDLERANPMRPEAGIIRQRLFAN
ncbi:MAG: fused MFS/spermidine synthase [Desulfobacterales bacterium]|jgi:spermidine synthase